uniref:Uncharacterized protein n=1 Tax=Oryza glumipatula TaxID=40148 RepID=A0A0D9Z9J0_9ORYZ
MTPISLLDSPIHEFGRNDDENPTAVIVVRSRAFVGTPKDRRKPTPSYRRFPPPPERSSVHRRRPSFVGDGHRSSPAPARSSPGRHSPVLLHLVSLTSGTHFIRSPECVTHLVAAFE